VALFRSVKRALDGVNPREIELRASNDDHDDQFDRTAYCYRSATSMRVMHTKGSS
jgi:hypothetical protein